MPTQTVHLTFQDPSGNPLANGLATFRLSADGSLGTSGGPSVFATLTNATLDGAGSCTVHLWATDQLLPAGSVYFVNAFSSLGEPAWSGQMTVIHSGGGSSS
jgi:hypothetical protein